MDNLLGKSGCRFKAMIRGEECEGVVYVENRRVYLLQNIRDGASPDVFPKELGFRYSWAVSEGTPSDLTRNMVEDFELIEESTSFVQAESEGEMNLLLLFL